MAKKKIQGFIKLQIPAGQANPAPPVGPALGQAGIKIMDFCKSFNDSTKAQEGTILPVVITVYADKTFSYIVKSPPCAVLLKKAAGIAKASGQPNKEKMGKVTKEQIKEIAQIKIKDLNAKGIEGAIKTIEGTARNMGIEVE